MGGEDVADHEHLQIEGIVVNFAKYLSQLLCYRVAYGNSEGYGNLLNGDVDKSHLAPWLSLPVGRGEGEAVVCTGIQGEGLYQG